MKFKHVFIAVLCTGLIAAASCKKKDHNDTQPKTTAEKIQTKWMLESLIEHDHTNGADNSDTTVGTSTDYFDFRPDGKLYVNLDGELDSVTYALQNDSKIIITQPPYASIYDIQTLTDHNLKLYGKETDPTGSSDDYYEATINLKK